MELMRINRGKEFRYTPSSADVPAGTVVVQGSLVGVTNYHIVKNEEGIASLEGKFLVPKGTGEMTQGAKVYWDATNKVVVTTEPTSSNGYVYFGVVAKAASSAATTVEAILNY